MQRSNGDDNHRGTLRDPRRDDPPARVRVLVADRHEATRIGLRLALEEAGFEICAECGSARDTLTRALEEQPDVCVVDAELPGGGLRAATAIADRDRAPGVIVRARSSDAPEFFAALRAGVRGYLLKQEAGPALLACVHTVAAGKAYVGQPFLTRIVDEFRAGRRLAAGELSPREREVLLLLGDGLTTKGVAAKLGLSSTTVRRHVSSALQKLGCDDRETAFDLLRVQPEGERR